MLKFLLKRIKRIFRNNCKYCNNKAVVLCVTYKNKKVYMCSDCLRAFRFRERECFKSVMPYDNKVQ